MRSSRRAALAAAVMAVVVAGCAGTIDGSASPNAAAVAALTTSSSSTSSSGSSTEGTPTGTSSTESTPTTSESTSSSPQPTDSTGTGESSAASSSGAAPVYPSTPATLPATPSNADLANQLEGRRIANYLVVPTLIDSSLTKNASISTRVIRSASAISVLFPSPMATVAGRAGMLNGFSSARSDTQGNALVVAAFEFGSDAAAKAAVGPMNAAAANKESDKGKTALAGFPASVGWYGTLSDGTTYLQSFLAQGRMILYLYTSGESFTVAQQNALAVKTFKAQTASMAKFVPTAPDKLMSLATDTDGLLAHTLANQGDDRTVNDGTYSATGQLHYDTDPVGTQQLFTKAGVDLVGDGRANVYRAKDQAGATLVRDAFIDFVQKGDSKYTSYTPSADVPTASCLQQTLSSIYYCVATQGRYVLEVSAQSEGDLNAALAAQYAMLDGFA